MSSINETTIRKMIELAETGLKNSYAPYSEFNVSAVVLTDSGKMFSGVNVENASYPVGICAERSALFSAISAGERKIAAVALLGGKNSAKGEKVADYCWPCGMCRQALREFANPKELLIISAKSSGDYVVKTLEELMPESFGPDDLK